MKKIFSLIFITITSWNYSIKAQAVSGDNQEVNKYLEIWNNESINDTARLDAFNKAIWIIKNNNLDSAFVLAEQSYEYALEKGIKNKIARATNIKGVIFKLKGREKEALEYYQKSLSIYKEINDLRGITIQNNNIASSIDAIKRAVTDGHIPISQINSSALKMLKIKAKVGLNLNPHVDMEFMMNNIATKENNKVSNRIASEAITLIKDKKTLNIYKDKITRYN